jgi:hypothetical protein
MMSNVIATDFTDFHCLVHSDSCKSVKFAAEVLAFPLKTVEPKFPNYPFRILRRASRAATLKSTAVNATNMNPNGW